LVEGVVAGHVIRRDAEAPGEFLREHALQRNFSSAAVGDRQQLRPDDGDDTTLFDIFE
jgi:hypothetical protein